MPTTRRPYDRLITEEFISQYSINDRVRHKFGSNTIIVTHDNQRSVRSAIMTPREELLMRERCPVFSAIPFYYLKFLVESDPEYIVDIGCGGNIFKDILPVKVHGIDPTPGNPFADEFDFFDSDFSIGHENYYDAAFSIDALHYVPITELKKQIVDFYRIVKKDGWGYLALNSERMIQSTDRQDLLDLFGTDRYNDISSTRVCDYVDGVLSTLPENFIIVENIVDHAKDQGLDGNIRMVFKKCQELY